MSSLSTLCAGCEKEGAVRCSGCHKIGVLTRYCSVKCQRTLWTTHKNHCGKNDGIFLHNAVSAQSVELFVQTIIRVKATENYGGNFLHEISHSFTSGIAILVEKFPPIPASDLNTFRTKTLYTSFSQLYFQENAKLSKELQSLNNFGIQKQLAALDLYHKISPYGQMPDIDALVIEKDANHYISTTSTYHFLSLNFFTVLEQKLEEGNLALSEFQPGFAEKSLLHRVVQEAKKLKIAGNLKYFEETHMLFEDTFKMWL